MTRMTGDATLARACAPTSSAAATTRLVSDTLDTALASEPVVAYVVHHEAIRPRRAAPPRHRPGAHPDPPHRRAHRRAPGRRDVAPPRHGVHRGGAHPKRIDSVVVTRVAAEAEKHRRGAPVREVVLTIGWGAVSRIDLEPASCGDPQCEADHGYTGTASNDDLALRVSGPPTAPRSSPRPWFRAALSESTAHR